MELVYTGDLKSPDRQVMRVRPPHSAPKQKRGWAFDWPIPSSFWSINDLLGSFSVCIFIDYVF